MRTLTIPAGAEPHSAYLEQLRDRQESDNVRLRRLVRLEYSAEVTVTGAERSRDGSFHVTKKPGDLHAHLVVRLPACVRWLHVWWLKRWPS